MILFILTILYLLGEIYTINILIKPIPKAIETLKKILEKNNNYSIEANISASIFTVLLFSVYYYLSSKYINNIYFSIISIIFAIISLINVLPSLIYFNNVDHLIEIKCNKRNIIISRIREVFIVIYVLIVLIKMFI